MIAPTTLAVADTFSARRCTATLQGSAASRGCASCRRVGAHQLERAAVGREQAADRVDRDGKERQVRSDHRDGAPVLQWPRELRVQPDDDHRRDDEDRHRLRRHHPGQEAAREDPEVREQRAEREPEHGAEREADGRSLAVKSAGVEEDRDQQGADGRRAWRSTTAPGRWCAGGAWTCR
jgi:hypothetical protein